VGAVERHRGVVRASPVIIFAVISAVLATVASPQGPLILLTQRRAAERDRGRGDEALSVAIDAEGDVHRLEEKIDALLTLLELPRS